MKTGPRPWLDLLRPPHRRGGGGGEPEASRQPGLVANAGDVGPYLTRTMAEAVGEHANVGEVRGEGMLTPWRLVKNRDTREAFDPPRKVVPRIAEAMGRRGVIARAMPQGDIIGYAPPLIVSATADALKEVCG
jgi:L-2,4-diaminobutyrate transaminase